MIGHEGGDKIVAVVVARVAAQRQGLAHELAGLFQFLGEQLGGQELVGQALVHQDAGRVRCRGLGCHQRAGVVSGPGREGHKVD